MRLCHNMNSVQIHNVYTKNLTANSKASERINTGLKINSAKDNPGKIGQLNKMNFQSRSLQAAQRNVQDGASMLQVSDGALQEVSNILSRMKELMVSAADGTKAEGDLDSIQEEINQLKSNLNDISENTEFNGVKLLKAKCDSNGNVIDQGKDVMVGAMVGENDTVEFFNCSTGILGKNDFTPNGIDDINVKIDPSQNTKYITTVDSAIDTVNKYRGEIGAKSNVYNNLVDINEENSNLIESAASRIGDADIAEEALEVSRTSILTETGLALLAQSNRLPMDCLQIIQGAKR